MESVRHIIFSSESPQHAGRSFGGLNVDFEQPGVRMHRSHHDGMRQVFRKYVIAVRTLAKDEPQILKSPQRLADTGRFRLHIRVIGRISRRCSSREPLRRANGSL